MIQIYWLSNLRTHSSPTITKELNAVWGRKISFIIRRIVKCSSMFTKGNVGLASIYTGGGGGGGRCFLFLSHNLIFLSTWLGWGTELSSQLIPPGVYILQWTLILSSPLLFRFDSFPHIFTTSASKACT